MAGRSYRSRSGVRKGPGSGAYSQLAQSTPAKAISTVPKEINWSILKSDKEPIAGTLLREPAAGLNVPRDRGECQHAGPREPDRRSHIILHPGKLWAGGGREGTCLLR